MTQQDIEDEKRKWAADPRKKRAKNGTCRDTEKPVRQFDGQDYYLVYKINVKSSPMSTYDLIPLGKQTVMGERPKRVN